MLAVDVAVTVARGGAITNVEVWNQIEVGATPDEAEMIGGRVVEVVISVGLVVISKVVEGSGVVVGL